MNTNERAPRLRAAARRQSLLARDVVRVPGLLSLSRVPMAALFPATQGNPAASIGLLLLAGATDLLDGWYARHYHQETKTGAVLDGITDKVFVATVVVTLLTSGSLTLIEALLLGTREIGELALVIRLAAGRKKLTARSANIGGKLATTLQYAAAVAIIVGSSQRANLVGAAALVGLLATISYWSSAVRSATAAGSFRTADL